MKAAVEAAQKENPGAPVPIDLVTSSAPGSTRTSRRRRRTFQVPRVARERGIAEGDVRRLVAAHTEGRQFGFLGEPVVNVLELNLALDEQYPMKK